MKRVDQTNSRPESSTMKQRLTRAQLVDMVRDARAATLAFVADSDARTLMGPKLDVVNPLLWEIGHVAWFQEHFILRRLDGRAPLRAEADALYDSARVAHGKRWDLPLPSLEWTKAYAQDVQDAVIERLDGPIASDLDSYFYQLVTFHEDMHTEAFTYSRQTLGRPQIRFDTSRHVPNAPAGPCPGDVAIPGGAFKLGGSPDAAFVFDNEKWATDRRVEPFAIARAPVTNEAYARFVEAGGYVTKDVWCDDGWAWLQSTGSRLPAYWQGTAGAWRVRHFDTVVELPPHQPVMFVNWPRWPVIGTWKAHATVGAGWPSVQCWGASQSRRRRRWIGGCCRVCCG
jgi:gamma-glutamyl hercynylcysteine S-oxide synthase